MRLERRLLLFGVALPAVAMGAALVGVGLLLHAQVVEGVDLALRAQATAESVSVFDRLGAPPHVHSPRSPLGAARARADVALYAADGEPLEAAPPAPTTLPLPADDTLRLRTVNDVRELVVRIEDPRGDPVTLWLATPMSEPLAIVDAYVRYAAGGFVLVVVLLLLVQRWHARWLAARVGGLQAHMSELREGNLDAEPAPDPVPDVIGRLRSAIASATEQLRAARRARERLVAGAAHELRTPIAAMRASVEVTLRRDRSADELRDALESVAEEIERLQRLATDLLDLAAVGANERAVSNVDLHDIARESLRRFEGDARARDVTLVLRGSSTPCVVVRDLVSRALDNLVSNALRFAPLGTEVTVRVERRDRGCALLVGDQGPGVPPEDREAIFTPFHRRDRQARGAGLGLALVKEVAEVHGGEARIEEADGGGALFELWLPSIGREDAPTR